MLNRDQLGRRHRIRFQKPDGETRQRNSQQHSAADKLQGSALSSGGT